MAKELAARKDVPVEETWDLSLIYETEELMYQDADKMKKLVEETISNYKGNLNTAEKINACLDNYREIVRIATLVTHYTDLAVSVDYYDAHNMQRNTKIGNLAAELFSKLSFIESELLEQSDETLQKAIAIATDNKHYIEDVLRGKPHQDRKSVV